MPKGTFFNLPEDKKERVIESAIDEFQKHSYNKASVTRIVKMAGIAKGSFYQYFDDKLDLFKYIMEVSGEKKLKYITPIMSKIDDMGFFETVREIYIAGIKFAQENPRLYKIAIDFLENSDEKLKAEILGDSMPKSNQIFETLLEQGIERGEIKPEIDIKMTAFIITSLSVSITEYFIKEVKTDNEMDIMNLVDKMLLVFKDGIKDDKITPDRNIEDRFY